MPHYLFTVSVRGEHNLRSDWWRRRWSLRASFWEGFSFWYQRASEEKVSVRWNAFDPSALRMECRELGQPLGSHSAAQRRRQGAPKRFNYLINPRTANVRLFLTPRKDGIPMYLGSLVMYPCLFLTLTISLVCLCPWSVLPAASKLN